MLTAFKLLVVMTAIALVLADDDDLDDCMCYRDFMFARRQLVPHDCTVH